MIRLNPPRSAVVSYQGQVKLVPWNEKEKIRQRKIKDPAVVKMIPAARYIIYYATIITLCEFIMHVFDASEWGRTFAFQNLVFCAFTMPYYILAAAGKTVNVTVEEAGGWYTLLSQLGTTFILLMASQFIIAFILGFELISVSDVEIYLFYLSAGICEEICFRFFPITILKMVIPPIIKQKPTMKQTRARPELVLYYYTPLIITVAITAVIFMFAHSWVYGGNFLLMLSTFIAGVILGTSFYLTGNIFATIFAHVLNNSITAGVVVKNAAIVGNFPSQVLIIIVIFVAIIGFIVAFRKDRSKRHQQAVTITRPQPRQVSQKTGRITGRDLLLTMIGGLAFSFVIYWIVHAFTIDTIDEFLAREMDAGLAAIDTINFIIILDSITILVTFTMSALIVTSQKVPTWKIIIANVLAAGQTWGMMWGISTALFNAHYPWIVVYPQYANAVFLAYVLGNPVAYFVLLVLIHVFIVLAFSWGLMT